MSNQTKYVTATAKTDILHHKIYHLKTRLTIMTDKNVCFSYRQRDEDKLKKNFFSRLRDCTVFRKNENATSQRHKSAGNTRDFLTP